MTYRTKRIAVIRGNSKNAPRTRSLDPPCMGRTGRVELRVGSANLRGRDLPKCHGPKVDLHIVEHGV